MKNNFFPVTLGLASLASTVLISGCAAYIGESKQVENPVMLSTEQCQPDLRDRPGTEVIKVAVSSFNAKAMDDTFILTAVFDPQKRTVEGQSAVQKIPFEHLMETSYVSGVSVVPMNDNGGDLVTEVETSMFAVGYGGYVAIEDKGDQYSMRLKYRDVSLLGIDKIEMGGDSGSGVYVQSPKTAELSRDMTEVVEKKRGLSLTLYPASDDRHLLVQRCWYSVPGTAE